jgi:outer membrane protein assembly factor BamA
MVEAPARGSSPRRVWTTYGATAGVAVDTWRRRVVGLSVAADFADPLEGTIPFTDRVSLGGNRPMRGFLQGRLIDRSSIVASLQYTWPIWVYLDGLIQTDVGNVFGAHLAGFDPDLLRLSSGIGVRSTGDPSSGLEVMVAGGTDPFEDGFRVSSFRLVVGSHHGF